MHSSTSASDPFPLRLWLPVLIAVALLMAGLESTWRERGFRPGPEDSAAAWSIQRQRATDLGNKAVVLAGSSVTREGFDPAILSRELPPYQFVMLAVDGASMEPTLRDLAADPLFTGTVICEMSLQLQVVRRVRNSPQLESYIQRHAESSAADRLDHRLRVELAKRLVLVHNELGLMHVVDTLLDEGRLPLLAFRREPREDRFEAIWNRDDPRAEEDRRGYAELFQTIRPAPPEYLAPLVAEIASQVRAIESRGGRVVFVHPVIHPDLSQVIDERLPPAKKRALATAYGAELLDLDDQPGKEQIELPDGLHVDARSVERNSQLLAAALAASGVLPRARRPITRRP